MGYNSIAWLPICAGLTVLGLALSYLAGRRRGRRAALRGAAWSLLPVAAYLTGSVEMFWRIGAAIGRFAGGFVFSPVRWAGIAVAGLSALLFVVTRGQRDKDAGDPEAGKVREAREARKARGRRVGKPPAEAEGRTRRLPKAPPSGSAGGSAGGEDMREIEEILRNRGID